MIFHENCLLADNSHEISYLIFSKIRKDVANLSSAAVVIGALRVKIVDYADLLPLPKSLYWIEKLYASVCLFVLLLYVPSQQLCSWRDGQFT